jgi:hypothetical protein
MPAVGRLVPIILIGRVLSRTMLDRQLKRGIPKRPAAASARRVVRHGGRSKNEPPLGQGPPAAGTSARGYNGRQAASQQHSVVWMQSHTWLRRQRIERANSQLHDPELYLTRIAII